MNEPGKQYTVMKLAQKLLHGTSWSVLQKDECFNLFATKSGSLSGKLSIVISKCSATFSRPPVSEQPPLAQGSDSQNKLSQG